MMQNELILILQDAHRPACRLCLLRPSACAARKSKTLFPRTESFHRPATEPHLIQLTQSMSLISLKYSILNAEVAHFVLFLPPTRRTTRLNNFLKSFSNFLCGDSPSVQISPSPAPARAPCNNRLAQQSYVRGIFYFSLNDR